jgi:thioredoxin reductase
MKEIVIIGGGVSGINLIEKIKASNIDIDIALIDKKPYFFSKKNIFSSINSKDWFFFDDWAKRLDTKFMRAQVKEISIKRRKIYFKDGQSLEFSNLILATGLKSKKISIKGEYLNGFFYLSEIDPFKLRDYLKIYNEITIYVSTFLGIRFSLMLSSLGKEIKFVASDLEFLNDYKDRIIEFLKNKNITVYENSTIEEVIGEGNVKAVRISPFKIISSQLVFIDSGFVPNFNFFTEDNLEKREYFFTNYEGVYFLGDVNIEDAEGEHFFLFNYHNAIEEANSFFEFILNGKNLSLEKRIPNREDKNEAIEKILKGG